MRDAAELMLGYQHPVLALRLDGRRYLSARVAEDRLVPAADLRTQLSPRVRSRPSGR